MQPRIMFWKGARQMKKLWQTNGGLHPLVESYTVGNDYIVDMHILPYDLQGTAAHVKCLAAAGVLDEGETHDLLAGLADLEQMHKLGKFTISVEEEDCHTAIENYLTSMLGDLGKKVHTGRSRNDQVATALRLLTKDKLGKLADGVAALQEALEGLAQKTEGMVMPGYTHSQRAMPLAAPVWVKAYISSLRDDLTLIESAMKLNDYCPLGSAAGFGSPIALDRTLSAQTLGFSHVEENTLYCQHRGKAEAASAFAAASVMATLSKLASDLLLFAMQEFGFFSLPSEFTTGSSMMPNKKNFDAFELVRANGTKVLSLQFRIQELSKNLMSGYNRDYQLLKEPLIEALETSKKSLELMALLVKNLVVNEDKMKEACSEDIYLTEECYKAVAQGIPFRDAYMMIKSGRSKSFWR
jgi:argininosuccinate lyase